MAKRTLSPEEKTQIAEERRRQEVAAHPDKMIAVHVGDETDDDGAPIVSVHYVGDPGRTRKH
jgi:hypothetical protein